MARLLLAFLILAGAGATAVPGAVVRPYESTSELPLQNRVDDLVFSRLKAKGIVPANLCSDAVFVRRAYLDIIGTLPNPLEARDFLLDRSPKKRSTLIDRLLERDEFADYWAMKWSDLLRVKAEFPINLWPNAAQAYHRWIRTSIKQNVPYDQFVREMLTASGSNFRSPPVNFYRAMQNKEPQSIAQAVALTFMGTRADKWPKDRWAGMAGFFSKLGYKYTSEWKEEIVYFDPAATNTVGTNAVASFAAVFPDGTTAHWPAERDPREVFAEWLTKPQNPWFARNIANRVWSWLLGRGIIQEADDIRPDNPPSNPELLAFLERELVTAHYDLKHLYRLILNSKTYQLSSIPGCAPEMAESAPSRAEETPASASTPHSALGAAGPSDAFFSHYLVRRLEAEVLLDALNEITLSTDKYSSAIPEPFTYMPDNQRSIALPDGSITSPFLEMFGRPSRDTGLESERNNRPTAAQQLHLLNSSHILRKLEQSRLVQYQAKNDPHEIANAMYLRILSRFPTEEELKSVEGYFQSNEVTRREAVVDVAWALINSAEFLYRH
jgi:Protein of unknown function (DUF1553)/Protein of unknown function (DUF1549)